MQEKQQLRQYIKEQKKRYSPEQLTDWSLAIQHKIEATDLFLQAHTILLYHSMPDEVQTSGMLNIWQQNKRCLLPLIQGDSLIIKEYVGEQNLQKGAMGIFEPTGEAFTDYEAIDLVIVPGMAFDRKGNRLGRGKGYYDRLLPSIPAPFIGICFQFQYVESVPVETSDIPMLHVITNK